MRSFTTLLIFVLAACVSAVPAIVTIPLTKLQHPGAHLKMSPGTDRARSALLQSHSINGTINGSTTVPAISLITQYTTRVGIGNPPTYYNLHVDTGSSNTFCGTGRPYVRTNTSIPTGQHVNATYGTGFFAGLEFLDQVTLAPNLVITNQSIGDALSSADFQGVDGIIGLGPLDLTRHRLHPDVNTTIPTVMNNLVKQGLIKNQTLGVYFAPPTKDNDTNGALTYGGADPSLYKGELTFTPVTKTFPSSLFWGINITSVTYGNHTVIPTSTAGIVDTGTTLVLLADDFFDLYMRAIPGAKLDLNNTGLIEIPPTSVPSMHPLSFAINGRDFCMNVASQLVPRDQNILWGGDSDKRYGIVANMGNFSRSGFDFILGEKFMERYYTVFDADTNRVGFAETNHTFSSTTEE